MIHNTTGPGVETTANGILVVNAINGGTTATGAFTLGNPELRAGAFDYRLFRGGLNGSDPNDWFLRSSFIVPPVPPGPVDPITPRSATGNAPARRLANHWAGACDRWRGAANRAADGSPDARHATPTHR